MCSRPSCDARVAVRSGDARRERGLEGGVEDVVAERRRREERGADVQARMTRGDEGVAGRRGPSSAP